VYQPERLTYCSARHPLPWWRAAWVPKNIRLIHLYSDCSNSTRPVTFAWGRQFLVRFGNQAVASVTNPGVRHRVDN
jgi:hypothetical protein